MAASRGDTHGGVADAEQEQLPPELDSARGAEWETPRGASWAPSKHRPAVGSDGKGVTAWGRENTRKYL